MVLAETVKLFDCFIVPHWLVLSFFFLYN